MPTSTTPETPQLNRDGWMEIPTARHDWRQWSSKTSEGPSSSYALLDDNGRSLLGYLRLTMMVSSEAITLDASTPDAAAEILEQRREAALSVLRQAAAEVRRIVAGEDR